MPRLKKASMEQRRLKIRQALVKYRETNGELNRQRNREALALRRANEEYRIKERRKAREALRRKRYHKKIRKNAENRRRLLNSEDNNVIEKTTSRKGKTAEQPIRNLNAAISNARIKQELLDNCSEMELSYSIVNASSYLDQSHQGNSDIIDATLIKTEIKIEPTQICGDDSTDTYPNINPSDFLIMQNHFDNNETN